MGKKKIEVRRVGWQMHLGSTVSPFPESVVGAVVIFRHKKNTFKSSNRNSMQRNGTVYNIKSYCSLAGVNHDLSGSYCNWMEIGLNCIR